MEYLHWPPGPTFLNAKKFITTINGSAGLLLPRVEDFHSRLIEIAPVARDDRESVVKGGRRAWACALPTEYWYPATKPSKDDITRIGEAFAGRRDIDVPIRRSL